MALISVWLALLSLLAAVAMASFRPAFNDALLVVALYGAILACTLAGLVLWGTRKSKAEFALARLQSKVALALAAPAMGIVYLLVALAQPQPSP